MSCMMVLFRYSTPLPPAEFNTLYAYISTFQPLFRTLNQFSVVLALMCLSVVPALSAGPVPPLAWFDYGAPSKIAPTSSTFGPYFLIAHWLPLYIGS